MSKGTYKPIEAIICRDGVLNGSPRMVRTVLAKEVDEMYPYVWEGMHGFAVKGAGHKWWIPAGTVIEVRLAEEKG